MASGQASTPDKGEATTPGDEQGNTMKKGITMRVTLYIEGDDAPAHDFSQTGADVASKVLAAGIKNAAGGYTVQVKKIEALEGSDDEDAG